MSYRFTGRVRYSEVGEDECLTLNGILNYFQDCSTFHSEDIGLGLDFLRERGFVWVLSSWQIVVERYPKLGEHIVISTWPYGFKGVLGLRNFTLDTEDGERLAYANTVWSFIDVSTGLPSKILTEAVEGYGVEERLDMDYASRKVPVPREAKAREAFQVKREHLDTNHHVNNGQYVQMAREYIPAGFPIRQMRAEYKRQAFLGTVIVPKVHIEDELALVALCGEDGLPFAVVEFTFNMGGAGRLPEGKENI